VHFNDKSAYGVVASCLEALTNVEGDWKRELRFLRDAARILASYRPSGHVGGGMLRVPVAEGVVETWEQILSNGEGTDVTLACRGSAGTASSSSSSTELRAHAMVLRGASRVLRAMLSPSFREGSTARVEVDFEASAVKLLLSLIYTGEEVEETEAVPDTLLASLELAHQWDVSHAVTALEFAIVKRLDDERFGRAMEVATRLQLPQLSPACLAYAKNSAEVRKRFKASQYPATVQTLLAKVFGDAESADSRRKRRRLIMSS